MAIALFHSTDGDWLGGGGEVLPECPLSWNVYGVVGTLSLPLDCELLGS